MTSFQMKIQGILDGTYTIPQEDLKIEQRLWERQYVIEDIDLTEDEEERIRKFKEYQRNYHREYYRKKLAKGKWTVNRAYIPRTKESARRSQNKRQYNYRSKKCVYLGDTLNFGTLLHRLFKIYGNWPEATAHAKLYLIKDGDENNE
jgi:hypothetical protein